MRRAIFILLMVWAAWATAQEQEVNAAVEMDEETRAYVDALDSLTNELFSANIKYDQNDTLGKNKYGYEPGFVPVYADSFIAAMMADIPSEIDFVLNEYVDRYIEVYSVERRDHAERILGWSDYYFPIFEEELDKRDMPHELKYLAIVESALNPNAVSRVGATGMWQIMYSTGRMLDLEINSYVDERRDPERSTDAAFDYLNKMYNVYGDWLLVIAAYNCGPGNVNKAIRRSGGGKTFWEIRQYLPRETRGYVPAFVAATMVFSHPEEFNLRPRTPLLSFNGVDTVMIYKEVELQHIAEEIDMEYDELVLLNPSLRKRTIPSMTNGYALTLPVNKLTAFEGMRDSILNKMPSGVDELLARSGVTQPASADNGYQGYTRLTYVVKSGDNLGFIANWYDVSVSMIRQWNNKYSNTLHPGEALNIYITDGIAHKYKDIDKLTFAEKQSGQKTVSTVNKYVKEEKNKALVSYTVKSGDNLGFIAEWYGCTTQDVRDWNGIYGNTINVGQKLKLYVPEGDKEHYASLDGLSFNEKQNLAFGRSQMNMKSSVKPLTEEDCQCVLYEVKPGDTLWSISKRYPGVSVDKIKEFNNIGNTIKPGMKLRIQI